MRIETRDVVGERGAGRMNKKAICHPGTYACWREARGPRRWGRRGQAPWSPQVSLTVS